MKSPARLLAGAATATVGLAAVLVVGASPAAARTSCTAYASMPKTLHTSTTHAATLRMTLHGSAGCKASTFDNGATAYLVGPSGTQRVYERWTRFGTTQTEQFYANLNRSGTYRLTRGNVQVYDENSVRIPAHWTTTSVRITAARR